MRSVRAIVLTVAAGVALATTTEAPAKPSANGHRGVTVMTRNLYLGADLDPVMFAEDFYGLLDGVTQVWAGVQATDFNARVVGLADEIEAAKPDLIGLQEAVVWRIQSPGDAIAGGTTPAETVVYDFIQILLDELTSRGLSYEVAVSQDQLDVELPNWDFDDIRMTDRDAILVRRHGNGPGNGAVHITDTDSGVFEWLVPLNIGGVDIVIPRGWVSVDGTLHGKEFRFVNVHLEDDFPPAIPIQEAQAWELVAGPLVTDRALIVVGDFNSDAIGLGTMSYEILIGSGLVDTWTASGGATWGHDPDLLNTTSNLTQRLDLVLHDGSFAVENIDIVGDEVADITESGLWPSDHAGLYVDLKIVRP